MLILYGLLSHQVVGTVCIFYPSLCVVFLWRSTSCLTLGLVLPLFCSQFLLLLLLLLLLLTGLSIVLLDILAGVWFSAGTGPLIVLLNISPGIGLSKGQGFHSSYRTYELGFNYLQGQVFHLCYWIHQLDLDYLPGQGLYSCYWMYKLWICKGTAFNLVTGYIGWAQTICRCRISLFTKMFRTTLKPIQPPTRGTTARMWSSLTAT